MMATKKEKIIAVIGAILGLILYFVLIFAIICFLYSYTSLYSKYETDDITEYGRFENHIEMESEELFSNRSQLMIFPKEIRASYTVNQYYYSCGSAGFDNMYQMVLDYELPQEEFMEEVERLSKLSAEYDGNKQFIRYDTQNYKYPAYVTMFTKHSDYEYALIDEANNRIICILSCVTDIESLPVDKEYLPIDKEAYADEEGWYGYSMYHFYDGKDINSATVIMAE